MKNSEKTPEQIEKEHAAHKRYRDKNKERLYAAHKRYRDKNRARLNAHSFEYWQNNKAKILRTLSRHRKDNLPKALERERAYRKKNRYTINCYMALRRYDIKKACLDYLGGAVCCICGYSSPWFCQFDFHHYKGEKSFSIAAATSKGKNMEEIKRELDKCKVVCRNCHTLIDTHYLTAPDFPAELKLKIETLFKPSDSPQEITEK